MSNRESYDSHTTSAKFLMPFKSSQQDIAVTDKVKKESCQFPSGTNHPQCLSEAPPLAGIRGLYSSPSEESSDNSIGCAEYLAIIISWLLTIAFFPFVVCLCYKVVREYQRAVIFRMGRIREGGAKGPGSFFILPCVDEFHVLDLRTVTFDVPPQEVLTQDAVTIAVDAVVYYRVQNPTVAVANVEDYNRSTRLLASTTLRNVLGTKSLCEILVDREGIAHTMQASLDEATDPWGVKVERVEIKDVRLPQQLQRTMAAEAEATREARAKVIAAEGEVRAAQSLKEASLVLSESPGALHLRYLQTLTTIASERNSTVIFPLPIELLRAFSKSM